MVHASHANMPKVVKALLGAPASAGVDKDAASDEGVTPLVAAAMKVGLWCIVANLRSFFFYNMHAVVGRL